jgi:uncharacterized coiled-coil DUF342 family protein
MGTDIQEMLKSKFDELSSKRARIIEQTTPLREQRDKIVNESREASGKLAAQIRELEKDMPQIDTDLGRLSRALGGRSLSTAPPSTDAPASETPAA